MLASDIRKKYIDFLKQKGHVEIPPAPLVPPDDPTTLFTSSGMQQLVPYLKGEEHPMGTRLVDSQPSFRAEDIEEVGDNRHTTFFEMLGNWSLGDYFKSEQLTWFFEFLTKELGLAKDKLFVTVFAGDDTIPRDEDSIEIWQDLFATTSEPKKGEEGFDSDTKIYLYGAKKNWWSRAGTPENMPAGEIGGPDSEVFYDYGPEHNFHENSAWADQPCHLNCDCGRFLEIGNSVFMQYIKQEDGSFKPLPNKNVDFGGGLERLAAVTQGTTDIFQIDLIKPVVDSISELTGKEFTLDNQYPIRIIADHLRAATFMLANGIEPSNKMQGYILRRLLRRAIVKLRQLNQTLSPVEVFEEVVEIVIRSYKGTSYFEGVDPHRITNSLKSETKKFHKALDRGLREIEKKKPEEIDAKFAFDLFQTHGFPFEITQEILKDKGISLDKKDFEAQKKTHQQASRTAGAGIFKGGLADQSEEVTKLHTATHLLHRALRNILGDHVKQVGSNITSERLRFDFSHPQALTEEQIQKVEELVNQKIIEDLPVAWEIMEKEDALAAGALAFFREKYPDRVKVYRIGDTDNWFSMELCGGPHVSSTGEIGGVTIKKEEGLGAGVRRIYAILKQ